MPTYRSITISLVSQFDILTIPEYAPPSTSTSTSTDPFCQTPTLVDSDRSLVSVYIPTYPCSQFWLSYSVSAPHPPNALYYFKLFVDGAHVVSWGCGGEDGFKGRTMFGVYEAGESWLGERGVEKRVFCFASEDYGKRRCDGGDGAGAGDVMEVKVYRSNGRKRIWPEVDEFEVSAKKVNGQKKAPQHRGGGGVK